MLCPKPGLKWRLSIGIECMRPVSWACHFCREGWYCKFQPQPPTPNPNPQPTALLLTKRLTCVGDGDGDSLGGVVAGALARHALAVAVLDVAVDAGDCEGGGWKCSHGTCGLL